MTKGLFCLTDIDRKTAEILYLFKIIALAKKMSNVYFPLRM